MMRPFPLSPPPTEHPPVSAGRPAPCPGTSRCKTPSRGAAGLWAGKRVRTRGAVRQQAATHNCDHKPAQCRICLPPTAEQCHSNVNQTNSPPEAMAASTASCSCSGSGTSSRPDVLASPLRSAACASAAAAASAAVGLVGLSGCAAPGLAGSLRPPRFRPAGDLGLSRSIGPAGGAAPRLPAPAAAAVATGGGSRGWLAFTTCRSLEVWRNFHGMLALQAAAMHTCCHAMPCPARAAHAAHRQHAVEHDWLAALALHGHGVHAILAVPQLRGRNHVD